MDYSKYIEEAKRAASGEGQQIVWFKFSDLKYEGEGNFIVPKGTTGWKTVKPKKKSAAAKKKTTLKK